MYNISIESSDICSRFISFGPYFDKDTCIRLVLRFTDGFTVRKRFSIVSRLKLEMLSVFHKSACTVPPDEYTMCYKRCIFICLLIQKVVKVLIKTQNMNLPTKVQNYHHWRRNIHLKYCRPCTKFQFVTFIHQYLLKQTDTFMFDNSPKDS